MNEQIHKVNGMLETFLENNADARKEQVDGEQGFNLYYIMSVTERKVIYQQITDPYFRYSKTQFGQHIQSIGEECPPDQLLLRLCKGQTVLIYDDRVYTIKKSLKYATRSVSTPQVEASIVGPLEAFVESMAINLNLIRKHYQNPDLRVVKFEVGTTSHVSGYLLYDNELADKTFVDNELAQIKKLTIPNAQAVSKVQQHLPKRRSLLFPRSVVTERPDRTSQALSKGKCVYLIETSPFASIAPISFHDFMASMDDSYMLPVYSYFLLVLRYFALLATVILPGAYVAFTAFNPEVFRVQLALSIAGSRAGLPYPAFLEVTFMLVMMELLVEASLRVPKTIGPAATTVGGLILGEAASQANLVSDIMIIVVSAVAIANFVIPINPMSQTVRVLKYLLLFMGTVAGFFGLTIGFVLLVGYVFTLHNSNYSLVQSFKASVSLSTKSASAGRQSS
ncbi:spore germination protein [Cohnella lupini]|uniref:Spore germination protein n=1 Tax=Cohnella lupini TaxID=1294267 RepID=A0A3D9IV78_9BACL|nr:spore germination protein [Cohnella lupini]RED65642.1 spore germination protein [Cohnella lupini]